MIGARHTSNHRVARASSRKLCTDLHTRASVLYGFVRIHENQERRIALIRFFLGKVAKFLGVFESR